MIRSLLQVYVSGSVNGKTVFGYDSKTKATRVLWSKWVSVHPLWWDKWSDKATQGRSENAATEFLMYENMEKDGARWLEPSLLYFSAHC